MFLTAPPLPMHNGSLPRASIYRGRTPIVCSRRTAKYGVPFGGRNDQKSALIHISTRSIPEMHAHHSRKAAFTNHVNAFERFSYCPSLRIQFVEVHIVRKRSVFGRRPQADHVNVIGLLFRNESKSLKIFAAGERPSLSERCRLYSVCGRGSTAAGAQ